MEKHSLKRTLRYAKPYSFTLFVSFISAIIYVSSTLLSPFIVGKILDKLKPNVSFTDSKIYSYLIALLVVIVSGALFGYLMNYLISRVTFKTIKSIREDSFKKIVNVPIRTIDRHAHGDILARVITDIDIVQDGLLQSFTEAFTGIITIVVTLVFMLTLNYKIGLIVVCLTPLSLIVAMIIAKLSFKTFKNQSAVKGKLSSFTNEMVENQKVVIAYGHEEENIESFKEINALLYKHGVNAQFYSSLSNPATRFVNAIIYMAVATFGAIEIINNPFSLSVGKLSTFLSYASQYTKPFNSISSVAAELQNSFASLKRIYEWIDEEEINENDNLTVLDNCEGNIEFKHVDFSYNPEKPIIKDFTLSVSNGERIALVGPTGCGKTTLINLLMRFYDINSGEILIDGKNISNISIDNLRENIGMVLQDTWLFNGTIFDNIAYGKENVTKEEVIEASKKAFAHDFIMRLPNGYDTLITEDEGVSVGQKQLLCIARLMLRLPNVLILDEATSNIDTRTEIKISKAFDTMMEGRTSFVIAHRLSTIKNATKIIVMKDGSIVETGTHNELLALNGFYKEIYDSQFQRK